MSYIQDELDKALYTTLGGTNTNAGTCVFLDIAPDNQAYPYIIWSYVNEGDRNDTSHILKDCPIFIRAYATTPGAAKTIDKQIDAKLHRKSLTITGWNHILTRRENGRGLVETDSAGKKIWMRGAEYRVLADQ